MRFNSKGLTIKFTGNVILFFSFLMACSGCGEIKEETKEVFTDTWTERDIEGWKLSISGRFSGDEASKVDGAVELLRAQLSNIVAKVPSPAVDRLKPVRLFFSPVYEAFGYKAEFHPGRQWLQEQGRDPVMEGGVEFSNISIFEAENRRMPMLALHELTHAFHYLVLGSNQPEIIAAYNNAKASKVYDRVQRRDSEGRLSWDVAYAMTNEFEYFAESTEAFFGQNDFYPFNRQDLFAVDKPMHDLLNTIWNKSTW